MNSFVLVLVGAVTLVAQPIPAGMKVGLSMYLQAGYGGLKSELSEAADMMPEADYVESPCGLVRVLRRSLLDAH
jgi:hypothetical protein